MTARVAGLLGFALAAVVALVAALGPLGTRSLSYHVSASATDQPFLAVGRDLGSETRVTSTT